MSLDVAWVDLLKPDAEEEEEDSPVPLRCPGIRARASLDTLSPSMAGLQAANTQRGQIMITPEGLVGAD